MCHGDFHLAFSVRQAQAIVKVAGLVCRLILSILHKDQRRWMLVSSFALSPNSQAKCLRGLTDQTCLVNRIAISPQQPPTEAQRHSVTHAPVEYGGGR